MKTRTARMWLAALMLLPSMGLRAYEIGASATDPENPAFTPSDLRFAIFERNHEKMSALALLCLQDFMKAGEAVSPEQIQCDNWKMSEQEMAERFRQLGATGGAELAAYRDIIRYVRWPDDPARFIHDDFKGAGKFAVLTKGGRCLELANKNKGKFALSVQGLFCNSHFGRLQFLHAMAERENLPARETRTLLDEWAAFAFGVATGALSPAANYCSYWEGNTEFPQLAKVMYEPRMRDLGWCEERTTIWRRLTFRAPFPAWRVGDTFNMHCSDPLRSSTCNLLPPQPRDELIRKSAAGALLHLVQDAFSKSHTERGEDSDLQPAIVYAPVLAFRSYGEQASHKHGVSDKWPDFSRRPAASTIIDPVTASARILLAVMRQDRASLQPILAAVLGEADGRLSGPGDQYRPDRVTQE